MRPSPRGVLVALAITAPLVLTPPAAGQGQGQQRQVTIAARSCPSYEAITANRARNNIMESLKDLGVDTPYGSNGIPLVVNPAVEAASQPLCTPIANWAFTLGTGYQTRAVPGVWGSLSKVTGPFSPTIYTQDQIPLRDYEGNPYPGGVTIAGATTVTLTAEQRQLATTGNRLWIQGGTPTLPITDPETYAFGALRCATDNLNGDNVEWISYPPNTAHVFCYAYYVKPAPTSGTITVVKEATLAQGALPQKVHFTGTISYENSEFFLTPAVNRPDSKSFIRAAGSTWTFTEEVPALGTLEGVACTSATGTSTWTIDGPATAVTLGAGDHVTCTYSNRYRRPPSGLAMRKVTLGGVGTTEFEVTGEGERVTGRATTATPGIAVEVEPSAALAQLPAGTYRVNEQLPPDIGGTWTFERMNCVPGPELARSEPVEIEVPVGLGSICTFFNRFTPAGRIVVRKITLGGTASTRFQVRPERGDVRPERQQIAVTTEAGEAVTAEGDDLGELPIGEYSIQETIGGEDRWEVARVTCDDVPVPAIRGRIVITLTDGEPMRDCTFVNRRIPDVVPPDPPPPSPSPPVPVPPPPDEVDIAGETIPAPVAELRVTKRVQPRSARVGGLLRYRATVVNRGPDPAEAVTIAERYPTPAHAVESVRISKGSCRREPPRFCTLGTLVPGERVTIRVAIRPDRAGRFRNAVAVNTATAQQTRRGKRARAVARVRARQVPRFAG